MDAKEYLERLSKKQSIIENTMCEIQQWESIAKSITVSTEGERVTASGSKEGMADAIASLLDLTETLKEKVSELVKDRNAIVNDLEQLPRNEYDVLHKVYVQGYDLASVPTKVYKSYSSIKKYHQSGIESVQRMLDERSKT